MDNSSVSPRMPIGKLIREIKGENTEKIVQDLSEEFDMFRVVYSNSITKTATYAYIEHLLRVTTYSDDFEETQSFFDRNIMTKMLYLLELKERSNTLALQTLQEEITSEDLSLFSKNPCRLKIFQIKQSRLQYEEASPIYTLPRTPLIYLLLTDKVYILYTPTMTFVDGYDPYLATQKEPLIPSSFIEKARKVLYTQIENFEMNFLDRDINQNPINISQETQRKGKDVFSSLENEFDPTVGLKFKRPVKNPYVDSETVIKNKPIVIGSSKRIDENEQTHNNKKTVNADTKEKMRFDNLEEQTIAEDSNQDQDQKLILIKDQTN